MLWSRVTNALDERIFITMTDLKFQASFLPFVTVDMKPHAFDSIMQIHLVL